MRNALYSYSQADLKKKLKQQTFKYFHSDIIFSFINWNCQNLFYAASITPQWICGGHSNMTDISFIYGRSSIQLIVFRLFVCTHSQYRYWLVTIFLGKKFLDLEMVVQSLLVHAIPPLPEIRAHSPSCM